MKKVLILALAFISSVSYADTTAVERLLYDGLNSVEEMSLTTEKTRTEYRTVRVPATCYRTEYRQRCRVLPRRCRTVCDRRGVCRNQCTPPRRICETVPVSVPYTCYRNETRAYQVHDYYVETNVKIHFNTNDVSEVVREEIIMKVIGERPMLSARGSKNYFLVLDRESRSESRRTGVKYVDLVYKVNLVPAKRASEVLKNGIQNVYLRNGILNFELGAGFNLQDFSQQIRIFQNRRIGTDPLLLNKFLSSNEINVQSINNASNISIDLKSLGINLPAKMRVILDTKFDIDENKILNRGEIRTSASANWIFR